MKVTLNFGNVLRSWLLWKVSVNLKLLGDCQIYACFTCLLLVFSKLNLPFFLLTAWLLLPLLDYELLSPIPSFEIEKKIKILQQCLIWRVQFNNPEMATHENVTLSYWCFFFFPGHLITQTLILVHRWNIYYLRGEWQWEVSALLKLWEMVAPTYPTWVFESHGEGEVANLREMLSCAFYLHFIP